MDDELVVGRVYDLELNEGDFRRCLYMGKRNGNFKYQHEVIRRDEEFIFSLVFATFQLKEGILRPGRKMRRPLNPSEKDFLDDRLKRAGL